MFKKFINQFLHDCNDVSFLSNMRDGSDAKLSAEESHKQEVILKLLSDIFPPALHFWKHTYIFNTNPNTPFYRNINSLIGKADVHPNDNGYTGTLFHYIFQALLSFSFICYKYTYLKAPFQNIIKTLITLLLKYDADLTIKDSNNKPIFFYFAYVYSYEENRLLLNEIINSSLTPKHLRTAIAKNEKGAKYTLLDCAWNQDESIPQRALIKILYTKIGNYGTLTKFLFLRHQFPFLVSGIIEEYAVSWLFTDYIMMDENLQMHEEILFDYLQQYTERNNMFSLPEEQSHDLVGQSHDAAMNINGIVQVDGMMLAKIILEVIGNEQTPFNHIYLFNANVFLSNPAYFLFLCYLKSNLHYVSEFLSGKLLQFTMPQNTQLQRENYNEMNGFELPAAKSLLLTLTANGCLHKNYVYFAFQCVKNKNSIYEIGLDYSTGKRGVRRNRFIAARSMVAAYQAGHITAGLNLIFWEPVCKKWGIFSNSESPFDQLFNLKIDFEHDSCPMSRQEHSESDFELESEDVSRYALFHRNRYEYIGDIPNQAQYIAAQFRNDDGFTLLGEVPDAVTAAPHGDTTIDLKHNTELTETEKNRKENSETTHYPTVLHQWDTVRNKEINEKMDLIRKEIAALRMVIQTLRK